MIDESTKIRVLVLCGKVLFAQDVVKTTGLALVDAVMAADKAKKASLLHTLRLVHESLRLVSTDAVPDEAGRLQRLVLSYIENQITTFKAMNQKNALQVFERDLSSQEDIRLIQITAARLIQSSGYPVDGSVE